MGNEMGNNNTSVLKDEDNTAVETLKTSLEDATHENDTNELHQLVPVVEGQGFHENVANLASDDAERIGNPCVENQTSNIEAPRVTMEAIEARDTDSKSDNELNDPAHEKTIAKNVEESDGQADEEDRRISTSDDLEPKENVTGEACQTSLLKSTQENDTNDRNQIGVEVEGNDFYENVAYLATDALKTTEDPCIKNQKSSTQEQEDSEVPPLGEFPQITMESTKVREEDSKVQPVTLSSDAGYEEPTEQTKMETDTQAGTDQHQLDKQDCIKIENEEGTVSKSLDLKAKESEHIESHQLELVTIHADLSVEVGSGSLLVSKDSLGPTFASDLEVNDHVLVSKTLKNIEESADSSPDPALERQEDALPPEPTACDEQLKLSEEQFETKNGQKVENGFSYIKPTESYDLVGLENNCNVELPTEVYSIDRPKLEPEVLLSNSHVKVPEPMDTCTVLREENRLAEKEMENGEEKNYTNQIQPCLLSGMDSELDCDQLYESLMVEPAHEKCQMIRVISPSSNKVSEAEDPKVVEDGGLVLMRLNNQHEASEDQCYQESERKLHVVPELGIISPELGIPHFSLKEEELVGKKNVQEREDNTQPSVAIEMEETERAEQDCLPPEESSFENVQSINNSITESKQENSSEFFAAENPAIDFTSWIAEALVSMNNLEAEMLGQQVTQLNEAHHAEAEALATESKTFAEVVTSSVSVSSSSETHETVGRSSTVSTESDPDNLAHAGIQKSPSFSLDLQNEARTEESDGTPLLFQDKAELESSASQGEKVDTLQRSESEESNTPFLRFLKEEEEINIVKQNIRENNSPAENATKNQGGSLPKKATTTSSKRKEKRRHRPSFFSNCLCCATVIS
ncbi:probable GPI-anchored adhesin-like protein PGA55 isoform X2 [Argentina anserina]|uniref:probable GPI-anchored adhesin-like protein PGA55 isoform X2 n=1 Tax=Argentina anserina TaxID=57926 RepID=UPI0021764AA3|nr:probable GPI-anchored adhesin-like protein PGA55 isoform X2 [Potentilla anserina]